MPWKGIALALLCAAVGTGCGTMANLSGQEYHFISAPGMKQARPYGGVAMDARWLGARISAEPELPESPTYSPGVADYVAYASYVSFVAADLPLSLIGDTVTLPLALGLQQVTDDEPPRQPSSQPGGERR